MIYSEILRKAVQTFGNESQIDIMMEECSELIKALSKYKRALKGNHCDLPQRIQDVCEEIADVKIVIAQMEMIFPLSDIVTKEEFKINRLKERMEKNENSYFSVEEYLPRTGKMVHVKLQNGEHTMGFYYDNENKSGWKVFQDGNYYNPIWQSNPVTHWRE